MTRAKLALSKFRRKKKDNKLETNSKVYMRTVRFTDGQHNCPICGPWEGENSCGKRHGKHGKTKRKYKDKR